MKFLPIIVDAKRISIQFWLVRNAPEVLLLISLAYGVLIVAHVKSF